MVFGLFLPLKLFPVSLQNFTMFGKFTAFNQRVFILNFGGKKIASHDGKVGCYTLDWLYFLWHGIIVFLNLVQLSRLNKAQLSHSNDNVAETKKSQIRALLAKLSGLH